MDSEQGNLPNYRTTQAQPTCATGDLLQYVDMVGFTYSKKLKGKAIPVTGCEGP
jgi:hypothetical protein